MIYILKIEIIQKCRLCGATEYTTVDIGNQKLLHYVNHFTERNANRVGRDLHPCKKEQFGVLELVGIREKLQNEFDGVPTDECGWGRIYLEGKKQCMCTDVLSPTCIGAENCGQSAIVRFS